MSGVALAESFAQLLRRFRVAASLTQEALAERCRLSPAAIAAIEQGRRKAPRLSVGWERIDARFERACTLMLMPDRSAEGRAELRALGSRPPAEMLPH